MWVEVWGGAHRTRARVAYKNMLLRRLLIIAIYKCNLCITDIMLSTLCTGAAATSTLSMGLSHTAAWRPLRAW